MRAVLWDLDGTIVDSQEFHWQAWRDIMAAEGRAITYEEFLATFGQRNDRIITQWFGPETAEVTIRRLGDAKEKAYRRLVRRAGISPLPGVAEWVERLRNGWRQAIASSAPRRNIEVVLELLGFGRYFQAIVSAEDVRKGKPDPEVFLAAAARLGVEPARCVVVEDAAAGTEAARRAGMRSIGVRRPGPPLEADLVVSRLDLLPSNAFDQLVPPLRSSSG